MDNFFKINNYKLDESQINSIKDDSKYILVCAGAGSGKSLTILGKVKYLIQKENYKENEILCISFTNESSKSLKSKLLDININVDVFTFHKLALNILENKYNLETNDLLSYIVNEYFNSYIFYDRSKRTRLNRLFFNLFNYNKRDLYNLKKVIIKFIHLAKSNNYNFSDIYKIYEKSLFRERIILRYVLDIFLIYKRELEATNSLDFDDLISYAIKNIKSSNLPYKYIIIDEFQDTSHLRYLLIKEIIKYTNSKLFVVGDDYQSIYRFTGCDLRIFTEFNKYFNNYSRHDLIYTYRFSNELIYISTTFIMKNKHQLRKKILSHKSNSKPVKICVKKSVYDIINIIDDKDILIIGRNNSDIKDINWNNKLTIHKSKGLEANNVILVNSDSIPSKCKNNKLLRHVTLSKDYIIYEEERRLFYVALTRTKNNIYIMVNKKTSPFVKELILDFKNYIEFI